MMRKLTLLFLLLPALSGPDQPGAYRRDSKRIAREQQRYAKQNLGEDLTTALNLLSDVIWTQKAKPPTRDAARYDISGYKKVYDQWADFERKMGAVADGLAAAGGAEAAKELVGDILDALDIVAEQEEIMVEARPKFTAYIYDQEPALRRYGAYQRRDVLVAALGKLRDPEGLAALRKEGWAEAGAWDKRRRRDLARVAVLDALALTGDEASLPLLEEAAGNPKPQLRIAALEALSRLGKPEKIAPRLADAARKDTCYAVRAAALDLLGSGAGTVAVVPALADALGEKRGAAERARLRRTLASIAGLDLGPDPAPWHKWHEAKARGDEYKADEKRTAEPAAGAAFERPLLLLECTGLECVPCDIDVAAKQNWFGWFGMAVEDRTFLTQWDVQKRDAKKVIQDLAEDARFNLLVMRGICEVHPFEEEGLAVAKPKTRREAEEFLDEIKPGVAHKKNGRKDFYFEAWCSLTEGLWATYRQAGLEPLGGARIPDEVPADVILVWADGVPALGPIIHVEAVIDDVRRLHRFFRIPIHLVRVGNTEFAEETMKGIAEATGGTYRWCKKP